MALSVEKLSALKVLLQRPDNEFLAAVGTLFEREWGMRIEALGAFRPFAGFDDKVLQQLQNLILPKQPPKQYQASHQKIQPSPNRKSLKSHPKNCAMNENSITFQP